MHSKTINDNISFTSSFQTTHSNTNNSQKLRAEERVEEQQNVHIHGAILSSDIFFTS